MLSSYIVCVKGGDGLIVLDLEWNRGYDKTPLDEILQIGAVRLDRPGGRIVDTFNVFIRPQVHKRLNRTAKALPEIDASRASTLDFSTAYHSFLSWCGDERDFAAWGADDFDTLNQNARYWKLPTLEPRAIFDLQTAFSLTLGTLQNIALWWAVEYCQIPECFSYHNALHDAMYTALTAAWVPEEMLELSTRPRWTLRYLLHPYPPQPSHPVGPHPSLRAALNSRAARKGACPLCAEPIWIQSWNYFQPGTYYTDLLCPKHGHFICRLTLSQGEDGHWTGRQEIPDLTQAMLEDYGRARIGTHYPCRGGSKGRRRYRRRRKDHQHERNDTAQAG